ncbi:hypothetical protein SB677_19855, partial [Bacillus sp. SIMBA_033]
RETADLLTNLTATSKRRTRIRNRVDMNGQHRLRVKLAKEVVEHIGEAVINFHCEGRSDVKVMLYQIRRGSRRDVSRNIEPTRISAAIVQRGG